MRIQAFATLTGLGVHTLRYYEKLGLLVPARNASGHRDYSRSELDWAAFIKRLKATDMPLEEIQRYALLRSQGRRPLAHAVNCWRITRSGSKPGSRSRLTIWRD